MNSNLKGWLAFLTVSILSFGSSFFWIKTALKELTPFEVVMYRCIISATCLWAVTFAFRLRIPDYNRWIKICFAAIVGGAFPNTIIAWSMLYVNSSLAGVLIGLSPIFTIILSMISLKHEVSMQKICGVILGFVGIWVMLSPTWETRAMIEEEILLASKLGLVIAAVCYSIFGVYAKLNFQQEHPVPLAAVSTTFSAIYVSILIYFCQENVELPKSQEAWVAVIWVGILTSALSQILIYYLIKNWGPVRLSFMSYIIPLTAIIIGNVGLGEQIDNKLVIGAVIIITATYCANIKRMK